MDGKAGTDQYLTDCGRLLISMGGPGFNPRFAIPIDPNGELLGGAHRLACALALRIEAVPVKREARVAWAPAWGQEWFSANGMAAEDLERLHADWHAIKG